MLRKYGRTLHLPQSPGVGSDDKVQHDLGVLVGTQVVVTEKMDGENTTIHSRGCHPRSPDARYHPSRDWAKGFAAGVSPQLSADERIVGEYLYARHSIAYDDLPSWYLGFAWIKGGVFKSWADTLERFEQLGVTSVPVLFKGTFSEGLIEHLVSQLDTDRQEGFVIRSADAFSESEMSSHVVKYVRANHVTSDTHWMNTPIVRNGRL